MPTIDELDPVLAATDFDEIALSQAGIARKATRAQIVAGLQPQMSIASGQLLGRASANYGAPEALSVGANLSLANGTLSAYATEVALSTRPPGQLPQPTDLVGAAQAGRNVAIPYATFMAGITGLPGLDASALTVLPPGATLPRPLAAIAGDVLTVEAFGARGDGITDDSNAFAAALAFGQPVRCGAKTYVLGGQFTIAAPTVTLLGVPGQTRLVRGSQTSGGAWIAVQSPMFCADGVIFDANRATISTESWGVLVTGACLSARFTRCAFVNAAGAILGNGLTFQASDPAQVDHVVDACNFSGNAAHGLWVQACAGVLVRASSAHDNAVYGICVDYNDASFRQKARLAQVIGNRTWANQRGISIGNFNATNAQPPVWGNANPDAIDILVAENVCHDNAIYGIAVAGQRVTVLGNVTANNGSVGSSGAGILANVSDSRIAGNSVSGGALFGIDCGGSIHSDFTSNRVAGCVFGINCGGSTALTVSGNTVQECTGWAIVANNVEADGNGQTFGTACTQLTIAENSISLSGSAPGGILLRDGPQSVTVARNAFNGSNGAVLGNCLWASTDSLVVRDNLWNATARFTTNPVALNGSQALIFPDIADTVMVTASNGPIQTMVSSYGVLVAGQVSFVRVTSGGQGYTHASVAIAGAGAGAAAVAVLSGGAVIGIAVTSAGAGYGAAPGSMPVTIAGDGTGAQATAFIGLPLAEDRTLRVRCNGTVVFARASSMPFQENASLNDLTVSAPGDVDWVATFGQWRAVRASPSLLAGCVGATGHGPPEGIVSAPPGSDYRNLDGGAGATLWVKRAGTGPTGWFSVA